jgi:anion-transporting  ArsA/GET3 family ATPase
LNSGKTRILVVIGKGGVGKTTVTAALGLRAAAQGKRVLMVEAAGAERLPPLFERPGRSYAPRQCAPNLYTLSITAQEAIEDYVMLRLRVRALYKLVFGNRIVGPFINAVPGLQDLVHLGKIYHLEGSNKRGRPEWDLIVFDAPSTGHGLSMLAAPQTMMTMTRAGPFHENAAVVERLFSDREKTKLVLVANPDEMVVNETLDLYSRLEDRRDQVTSVVLNEFMPAPFPSTHAWPDLRHHFDALPEAQQLCDEAVSRTEAQNKAHNRIVEGTGCTPKILPFLLDRDLKLPELQRLAQYLDDGT